MKNHKQILHLQGKHKTTPRPTKNQDDLGETGRCKASLGKEAGKALKADSKVYLEKTNSKRIKKNYGWRKQYRRNKADQWTGEIQT